MFWFSTNKRLFEFFSQLLKLVPLKIVEKQNLFGQLLQVCNMLWYFMCFAVMLRWDRSEEEIYILHAYWQSVMIVTFLMLCNYYVLWCSQFYPLNIMDLCVILVGIFILEILVPKLCLALYMLSPQSTDIIDIFVN